MKSRSRKAGRRAGRGPARRRAARTARVLRAGDLMTRHPITVPRDLTVGQLCDLLQEKNINGAPVVDARGRLVGVVTQEDIIYGAMGHFQPSPATDGRRGSAAGATLPPEPERAAPGAGPAAGKAAKPAPRRVVAMLRSRGLEALPPAPPREGERPFWSGARGADPMETPVGAIMTSPAISAEERTPVADLCRIMWSLKIHRVPILKGGKVTGLVSSMDLCRAILEKKILI